MKNRSLLNLVLVTALLMLSGLVWPVLSAEHIRTQSSHDANRQEAERLWELAIAAKGGRERLQAVSNLQISIREKVWYGLRRVPYIQEDLYVFPGKYWEWNDQRKSIFGLSIRMYNHDRDINLWYTDHGKGAHLGRPVDLVHGKAGLIPLYDVQLRYFRNYLDFDGIQMPSKIHGLTSSILINVDYDDQIFVRDSNVEGGIKQWSKK